jgi:hypothetical protein
MHGHVAGPQIIQGVDLHAIGIVLDDVIDFHPPIGPCPADDDAILRIERPQAMVHRAVATPEVIEDVAHRRHAQVFANPGKAGRIVRGDRHGGKFVELRGLVERSGR